MALKMAFCADVSLRNYMLTQQPLPAL